MERISRLGLGVDGEAEFDPVQYVLTVCVMLYCTDFVDLEQPELAAKKQTGYACLLQK